jgi:hypothetical protein
MIDANDQLLAARFAAIANPFNDSDWSGVLGRAGSERSGKGSLAVATGLGGRQRPIARRMVVVAIAAVILLVVGVAVAASISGWGIATRPQATVTEPSPQATVTSGTAASGTDSIPTLNGNAVKESGIFDTPVPAGKTVPTDVQTAMSGCPHCRGIQLEAARRVAQEGASALYAAPTVTGAVCYWLDTRGDVGGSCVADLSDSRPVSALSTETSSGKTVVAGVVRRDVTQVTVRPQIGQTCVATLDVHAFICILNGSLDANGVVTLELTLASGKTVVVPV